MNELLQYKAIYQTGSLAKDNPFIQALPEQLTGKALMDFLVHDRILPEQWETLPPAKRMELVEKLHSIYIPMDYSIATYNLVYRGLRTAYEGKSSADVKRQMEAISIAIQKKNFEVMPDCEHQADSFSLLGTPGMGKTETINRILRNIPKVIVHDSYFGKKINQIQIPYIRIQCPSNKSPKAACIQILHELDGALGGDYSDERRLRGINMDMMICKIAQLCMRFNVGIIVIDEIQNILRMNEKAVASKESFINFMVELSNKTGVSIVSVGTPEVERFFTLRKHLERRTRGPRIAAPTYDSAYQLVLEKMWYQLPLLLQPQLDTECEELIYKITGGVFSQVASLLISSTEYALSYGLEAVNADIIGRVAKMESYSPPKSKTVDVTTDLSFNPPIQANCELYKSREPQKQKKRGRPTVVREANDLLVIFDNCKKSNAPLPKMLEFKEIAIHLTPGIGVGEHLREQTN